MGNEDAESKAWQTIKKIGYIIGIVLPLWGAYVSFIAPKGKLVAQVAYSPFVMPPFFYDYDDRVRNTIRGENLERIVDKVFGEEGQAEKPSITGPFSYRQFSEMRDLISEDVGLNDPVRRKDFNVAWTVTIQNPGDISIQNVRIAFPSASYSLISRGEVKSTAVGNAPLAIDEIAPGERVYVSAWGYSSSGAYIEDESGRPTISGSSGRAVVDMVTDPTPSRILLFYGPDILKFISFLGFAYAAFSAISYFRPAPKSEQSDS